MTESRAKIWASLIKRGHRSIEDVPPEDRSQVEAYLNENEGKHD